MLSGASKAPVGLEQHVTAIATLRRLRTGRRVRRPVPSGRQLPMDLVPLLPMGPSRSGGQCAG